MAMNGQNSSKIFKRQERKKTFLVFEYLVVDHGSVLQENEKLSSSTTLSKTSSLALFLLHIKTKMICRTNITGTKIVQKDIVMCTRNKTKEDVVDNVVLELSFLFARRTDPCSTTTYNNQESSLSFLLLDKLERNFDHS